MKTKQDLLDLLQREIAILENVIELNAAECEVLEQLDQEERGIRADLENPSEETFERVASILKQYIS